jgi:hypothetical protein
MILRSSLNAANASKQTNVSIDYLNQFADNLLHIDQVFKYSDFVGGRKMSTEAGGFVFG